MTRNQPGARFAKVEAFALAGKVVELHATAGVPVAARRAGCVLGRIQERADLCLVQAQRATTVVAREMLWRKTRSLHVKSVAVFTP